MAQRATSLGPKPSLFLLFCFCFFVLCFVFFVCFGGFKGQVRWPKGPPHLALNPPYLFFLFFLFCSLFGFFWLFNTEPKTLFFPQKRAFLFIFSVSLSFSLCPFGPPSFSVSLSQSLFFLLFFLSSFLSLLLLSFGSLSLSLFFSFFLFLLCFSFMKGTTSKYSIASFFGLPSFLFFKFPVFFVSSSFLLS